MKIKIKSILAKLLATENISVEQQNIDTAAFNPTTRTLYIPKWKDMSNSLQDLLIGHEVGHAWDTPAEGWHDAVCSDPTLKGFLNVIEDARIERKIKTRYPGLVKSFYAGYRELFERDFFGVKDVDVNCLPLIDRINLHFKVGPFLNVEFSDSEKLIIDRCSKTETWEDVEALAREIHDKAQEDAEKNKEDLSEQFEDMPTNAGEDQDGESFGEAEGEQTDSEDDSELESGFSGGESDEFDELFGEDSEYAPEAIQEFIDSDGISSITDDAFRKNEKKLVDDSNTRENVYVSIPKDIDLASFTVDAKIIYKFENFATYGKNDITTSAYADSLYKEFLVKNKSVVNQMASAFEMKRKASLYVKAKTSKSGELDQKRLWSYKTSDNLFKQITSIPEGKNHGMIMYLDMSGSMAAMMSNTIDQLINLGMFCRKVNIPFEVYGFTSSDYDSYVTADAVENEMVLSGAKLVHLLSSNFTKQQTDMAYKCLLLWRESFNRRTGNWKETQVYCESNDLRLGTTPLNATIVLATEIAKKFREANKIEKFSTIFLTDGEATDKGTYWKKSQFDERFFSTGHDYKTAVAFKYGSSLFPVYSSSYCHWNAKLTATLLEMYKELTSSKLINYHIVKRWTRFELQDCRSLFSIEYDGDLYNDWDNIISNRSSGLIEVKDTVGFDARYIVKGTSLKIEDTELAVKSNSKGDLLRGFKKFAGNKSQSRLFVQKFIPQVA